VSFRVRLFSAFIAKASFVIVFLSASILVAAAQGTLSTIAGVVTDSQGAAVAGATLTATSHSTGVVTTGTSNAAGKLLAAESSSGRILGGGRA
jgi:hypothetical protein